MKRSFKYPQVEFNSVMTGPSSLVLIKGSSAVNLGLFSVGIRYTHVSLSMGAEVFAGVTGSLKELAMDYRAFQL